MHYNVHYLPTFLLGENICFLTSLDNLFPAIFREQQQQQIQLGDSLLFILFIMVEMHQNSNFAFDY